MARTIRITVEPHRAQPVLARLTKSNGVLAVRHFREVSIAPVGDLIEVDTTTDGFHALAAALREAGVRRDGPATLSTAEPASLVVPHASRELEVERSEASWDEMHQIVIRESNMTVNGLALMAASGALAAVGLVTDAVHLVIAAMLLAPAVEPIARMPLAAIGRVTGISHGLGDAAKGYGVMAAAAGVTALAMLAAQPARPAYYATTTTLVQYWSEFSFVSLYGSVIAALAAGILIATRRSVFTTGALVALTLNPSIAAAAVLLAGGRMEGAAWGLLRWIAEVMIVLGGSAAIFAWKSATVHPPAIEGQRTDLLT